MSRPSYDDWDTPGGPGGREEVVRRRRGPAPGAARALYHRWQETIGKIADERSLKYTVKAEVFNAFRRARLDAGITDDRLAVSFAAFADAVVHGGVNARQGDLWRLYAATWARWVSVAPAATQRPLTTVHWSTPRRR
jgi:hypothetical protein